MKRTLLTLAVVCLLALAASSAHAQLTPAYGNITAAGTTCATANACVTLHLPSPTVGNVSITIQGTYTGTQQFEQSGDNQSTWDGLSCSPQPSGAAVTSATAGDLWICAVGGATDVRVRGSAYVSGTAAVVIQPTNTSVAQASAVGTGASATQVQGTAADGAAAVGSPVQTGGVDGSGNAQAILTDTSGRVNVVGAAAIGAAVAGNPVVVGMRDGSGTVQPLDCLISTVCLPKLVTNSSPGVLEGTGNTGGVVNGSGATSGIGVNDYVHDLNNATLSNMAAVGDYRFRAVSATNTAQTITIDARNLHDGLAVHATCSAGTAALTVDVSSDNSNFLSCDSIAAAATVSKYYAPTTTCAVALSATAAGPSSPLVFRYIKVTEATCGVGNTSTLTMGAK